MNVLIDKLPTSIIIAGTEYRIQVSFRNWIRFELLMLDRNIPMEEKIVPILTLCYIDLPKRFEIAISEIIRFYSVYAEERKGDGAGSRQPIYSFSHDADYIYAAFLGQYGIDLQTADLHWWQFKALFKSLNDTNQITKIMEYRSIDLSKIKDKEQKAFYRKMKAQYKLPDLRTEEEKEIAMVDSLSKLF